MFAAKNTKINEVSGMPQMNAAFSGWVENIVVYKITQQNIDGFISKTEQKFKYKGTLQPLKQEEIQLKPEGERGWKWYQLHVKTNKIDFNNQDFVEIAELQYKIMAVKDYTRNNFVEYHLIKSYQNE